MSNYAGKQVLVSADEGPPVPQIEAQRALLNKEAHVVLELAQQLEKRLVPILRPQTNARTGLLDKLGPKREDLAPLAVWLLDTAGIVRDAGSTLSHILEQIEL